MLGFFSSCSEMGCSLLAVCGLLLAVVCLLEPRLWSTDFSSWGARAYFLRGLSYFLGSAVKSVSPALASGFFTTEPPGKPLFLSSLNCAIQSYSSPRHQTSWFSWFELKLNYTTSFPSSSGYKWRIMASISLHNCMGQFL